MSSVGQSPPNKSRSFSASVQDGLTNTAGLNLLAEVADGSITASIPRASSLSPMPMRSSPNHVSPLMPENQLLQSGNDQPTTTTSTLPDKQQVAGTSLEDVKRLPSCIPGVSVRDLFMILKWIARLPLSIERKGDCSVNGFSLGSVNDPEQIWFAINEYFNLNEQQRKSVRGLHFEFEGSNGDRVVLSHLLYVRSPIPDELKHGLLVMSIINPERKISYVAIIHFPQDGEVAVYVLNFPGIVLSSAQQDDYWFPIVATMKVRAANKVLAAMAAMKADEESSSYRYSLQKLSVSFSSAERSALTALIVLNRQKSSSVRLSIAATTTTSKLPDKQQVAGYHPSPPSISLEDAKGFPSCIPGVSVRDLFTILKWIAGLPVSITNKGAGSVNGFSLGSVNDPERIWLVAINEYFKLNEQQRKSVRGVHFKFEGSNGDRVVLSHLLYVRTPIPDELKHGLLVMSIINPERKISYVAIIHFPQDGEVAVYVLNFPGITLSLRQQDDYWFPKVAAMNVIEQSSSDLGCSLKKLSVNLSSPQISALRALLVPGTGRRSDPLLSGILPQDQAKASLPLTRSASDLDADSDLDTDNCQFGQKRSCPNPAASAAPRLRVPTTARDNDSLLPLQALLPNSPPPLIPISTLPNNFRQPESPVPDSLHSDDEISSESE